MKEYEYVIEPKKEHAFRHALFFIILIIIS